MVKLLSAGKLRANWVPDAVHEAVRRYQCRLSLFLRLIDHGEQFGKPVLDRAPLKRVRLHLAAGGVSV